MTRINVVPIQEMDYRHILAEYDEIPDVYRLVRMAIARGETPDHKDNPTTYRLGKGHVRFFYPRLAYVQKREWMLHIELIHRGYRPRVLDQLQDIPREWFGDYEPTEEAFKLNRKRISDRLYYMNRNEYSGYVKQTDD